MDYKRIYDQLMESRLSIKKERNEARKSGAYFERHHIIPLSMGGNKSYSIDSDNIVLLTAREHYLAHRMLWIIYKTREMGFAFHKMVFSQNSLQKRRFDSKAYEAARIALSECQRGENNPMFGRESPMKGKEPANKGKKLGPREDIMGENNPSKRKEVREKISRANKGKQKPTGKKSPTFGGYKILLRDGIFYGKYENLVDVQKIVQCTIHNLKSHIKNGKGGMILGRWQIFYEKDYAQKSPD